MTFQPRDDLTPAELHAMIVKTGLELMRAFMATGGEVDGMVDKVNELVASQNQLIRRVRVVATAG